MLLPQSVGEALGMIADTTDADPIVPVAGGTDVLVNWPENLDGRAATYLDLSGLAELRWHRWTDDELVLGGLTTYWDVIQDARAWEELPLLIEAGRQVGAIQIQARGTWAGNIANASPAADGVPVMMAYDARVELTSASGREEVALDDFYLGYKKMRRRPDQLITAIRIPRRPYDRQAFHKVGPRRAQAIAKVSVAVTHAAPGGWRVVAGSVAETVRRCRTLEQMLERGERPASPTDLVPPLRLDVAPIDDIRSTARYRLRTLAHVLFHELARDA